MRTGKAGRLYSDARAMVEGSVCRYQCGIAWPDVPELFGPWPTIWTWHRGRARTRPTASEATRPTPHERSAGTCAPAAHRRDPRTCRSGWAPHTPRLARRRPPGFDRAPRSSSTP
ncbi:transposase [Amycolatopsis sp. FDAARGOS 1241]|uniref:transposase n=1 Tax=Amycolatopsis sp. FDAARGOS 1241 TaxID=2778070 RepID=UPI00351C7B2C